MNKITAFALSLIAIPIFSYAQSTFQCPSDWNCFPKTITACPSGYTCVKNNNGFTIYTEGENVGKAGYSSVTPRTQGVTGITIDYSTYTPQQGASDLNSKIRVIQANAQTAYDQAQTLQTTYCVTGSCMGQILAAQKRYNFLNCQLNNLESQLGNLYAGLATSTAPQSYCAQYQ